MSDSENLQENVQTGYGIIRMLKEYGVKYIFGIPDGHTLPLYDAMSKIDGIEHILVNDERTAAFAADAYARVTDSLGVCDAGAAGSMNFPVGISEALGIGSPVLALVGSVKVKDLLRNVPHDIKISDTLAPITKWSSNVIHSENTPRFIDYAIRLAISGKPGPVALVFPEDILSDKSVKLENFIPLVRGSCSINGCRIAPAENEIDYAIELIRNSEQPVIYSGGSAVQSGAFAEIKQLSKILMAPVFSTITGKGIMVPTYMNDEENMYFGTVGLFGEKPNHTFLRKKADLIIVIGNRLTEDDTAYFKYPPQDKKIIHIDIDPSQIGLNYREWAIVGDPKAAIAEILHLLSVEGIINDGKHNQIMELRKQNIEWLRDAHKRYWEKDTEKWMETEPIKPQRVLKAISDAMNPEDYLITDASSSSRWIGPYFPVKSLGRKIITPRGVGPTGFGLGALIGTSIAIREIYPKDKIPKVVLFTGDGGFMNGGLSDLETFQRLGIDCAIIIINNSSLGYVKFGQGLIFHRNYYDTDRPASPFNEIVKSFGGKGITIEKLSDLDKVVKDAVQSKGLNLVNVMVDPQTLLPRNYY